jgi:serine/threonine protein phosphatase PrpC
MPSEATATTILNAAGASHPGRVRPRNEDRFHVDAARGIFIVVDGVGGHTGGERAAEIAVDAVRARLERDTGSLVERLREAIAGANEAIHDESRARPELSGMACVLTAALVNNGRVYAGHVGDTRLYKLRANDIVKLTHDHSPVGALEDDGRLGELEAMAHPRRHEVWRDVGTATRRPADPGFVEIIDEPFEPDSALLLCSDGLTDRVSSTDIASIVYGRAGSPAVAVQDLIWAANDAGGRDNVTAVIVEGPEFAGGGSPPRQRRPLARSLASVAPYTIAFVLGVGAAGLVTRFPLPLSLSFPFPRFQTAPVSSVSPVASQARTWRVGASPGADATTIGAALADARPGDLVIVESGTYRESITLREGISIVSAERHGAELRRPRDLPGKWTAVTATGIGSASIRGLRIVGTEAERLDVGVLLSDSVASLEDLEVSGAQDTAIRITGSSAVIVNADAEPARARRP